MKGTVRLLVVITALVLCHAAVADQNCSGTIRGIYITNGGDVLVYTTFHTSWLQICNSVTTWKGVDPVTCKSWIALVTTMRVTQEEAIFRFPGSTSCDALPAYGAAPAPVYVMYYVP